MRVASANCGWSGTVMTSLALRISTPKPLIPGTHAAPRACSALSPNPEESARKWDVGEQSSKCQKPKPPVSDPPSSLPEGMPPSPTGPVEVPVELPETEVVPDETEPLANDPDATTVPEDAT